MENAKWKLENISALRLAIRAVRWAPSGFTLLEMLTISALIIILSSIVYVTYRPDVAIKRARDTRRLHDIKSLEAALENYIADTGLPPDLDLTVRSSTQSSQAATKASSNGTGWIPVDLTKYIEKLPIDPRNTPPYIYRYYRNGRFYKFDATLEYLSTAALNTKDGGNDNCHYEAGSNYATITLPGGC